MRNEKELDLKFKNKICELLEIDYPKIEVYKSLNKIETYEKCYNEIKRRLFVADKLSEFLVDKEVDDVKDFFEGAKEDRIKKTQKLFTRLYCLDKSCKIDTRFYNNCLTILQNIKIEKNPCNY